MFELKWSFKLNGVEIAVERFLRGGNRETTGGTRTDPKVVSVRRQKT